MPKPMTHLIIRKLLLRGAYEMAARLMIQAIWWPSQY